MALSRPSQTVRQAGVDDAPAVARLLHDFNAEFSEPTPGVEVLTERVRELVASNEMTAFVAGDGPDGLAVLRFRPALRSRTLDAYLEELYVAPEVRGQGLGRALMDASLEAARAAGAAYIGLCTSEDDKAAIGLYESTGFVNREKPPEGPIMFLYERDL
jgi:ribosomal protein S18 acetylase RimI-like enzyme